MSDNNFYETRSDVRSDLMLARNKNHHYPSHFHNSLEIFVAKKGRHIVKINDKEFTIEQNDILVIDCFDIHSYSKNFLEEADDCVIIIPYIYLSNYYFLKNNKQLSTNKIHSPLLTTLILMSIDNYMNKRPCAYYTTQSFCDYVISLIMQEIPLIEKDKDSIYSTVIRDILRYINEHYTEQITIDEISKAVAYSKSYVSRIFNIYIDKNFNSYINYIRYIGVNNKIKTDTTKNISDIVYEMGFNSLRTYYRVKKNIEDKYNDNKE